MLVPSGVIWLMAGLLEITDPKWRFKAGQIIKLNGKASGNLTRCYGKWHMLFYDVYIFFTMVIFHSELLVYWRVCKKKIFQLKAARQRDVAKKGKYSQLQVSEPSVGWTKIGWSSTKTSNCWHREKTRSYKWSWFRSQNMIMSANILPIFQFSE